MTALAHSNAVPASPQDASVEALMAYLDYYGFDYFFKRTLRMIDLDDEDYACAVDEAVFTHRDDSALTSFSLRRAFASILSDLKAEGLDEDEALEFLAEDDYVVPVTTMLYYSIDAGETDVEKLSALIRKRAQRLMRQ